MPSRTMAAELRTMAEPRIWDISQRIHADIPAWPGEARLRLTRSAVIGPECPVNVSSITLPLHTGTHGDAPLHYDADGLASDQCALDPYLGPCVVIDASAAGTRVEERDCDWAAIKGHERVLIRTYRSFPHHRWDPHFKAIAPRVVERLGALGVRLIGVDTPSLDPQTCKSMQAHHQVRAANMRILEGLVLENVPCASYELIALPLAIAGADASPVRAILRELA